MVYFDGNAIIFAALGGILLGIATSLNYIVRGKVTGMSGIAYGIISLNRSNSYFTQLSFQRSCQLLEECFSFPQSSISSLAINTTMVSNLSDLRMKLHIGPLSQDSFYLACLSDLVQN